MMLTAAYWVLNFPCFIRRLYKLHDTVFHDRENKLA